VRAANGQGAARITVRFHRTASTSAPAGRGQPRRDAGDRQHKADFAGGPMPVGHQVNGEKGTSATIDIGEQEVESIERLAFGHCRRQGRFAAVGDRRCLVSQRQIRGVMGSQLAGAHSLGTRPDLV
jgi:hypothetical protein